MWLKCEMLFQHIRVFVWFCGSRFLACSSCFSRYTAKRFDKFLLAENVDFWLVGAKIWVLKNLFLSINKNKHDR